MSREDRAGSSRRALSEHGRTGARQHGSTAAREHGMGTDRVAIVTAGGSGMGAGAARRLAADGFRVAVLSSSGKGEALARELGGLGVTGSNQSLADLQRLTDAVLAAWGRIDVLVNSAGHGPRGPLLELTDDDWQRGMEVYFLNVVRPTRLVTPVMQRQKPGVIVNISTFAAFEPDPVFPTSGVFRAGLAAFTKLYADRYAAENIRMNNVLPGFIDSLPEKAEFRERIPLRRYGKTREIADVIAFLASDGAAYITGQNIRVDGGVTRSV
jgi:NAD(P)-dependent dehydrogenase (short-subunit alcohol dehydrogenase family)